MDVATYNFFQFQISLTYPHPYHLYDLAAKKIPKGKIVNEKIREEIYKPLPFCRSISKGKGVSLPFTLYKCKANNREAPVLLFIFLFFLCVLNQLFKLDIYVNFFLFGFFGVSLFFWETERL